MILAFIVLTEARCPTESAGRRVRHVEARRSLRLPPASAGVGPEVSAQSRWHYSGRAGRAEGAATECNPPGTAVSASAARRARPRRGAGVLSESIPRPRLAAGRPPGQSPTPTRESTILPRSGSLSGVGTQPKPALPSRSSRGQLEWALCRLEDLIASRSPGVA
jgi:hypothetical protein